MKKKDKIETTKFRKIIRDDNLDIKSSSYTVLRSRKDDCIKVFLTLSVSETGWSLSRYAVSLCVLGKRVFPRTTRVHDLAYRRGKWWGSTAWLEVSEIRFIAESLKIDWFEGFFNTENCQRIILDALHKKNMIRSFVAGKLKPSNFWNSYTKCLGVDPKLFPSSSMKKLAKIRQNQPDMIAYKSLYDIMDFNRNPIGFIDTVYRNMEEERSFDLALGFNTTVEDAVMEERRKKRDFYNLLADTFNMCCANGTTFNHLWSKKRMEEEHERLVLLQNMGLAESKNPDMIYTDDLSVTMLLKTARDCGMKNVELMDSERKLFVHAQLFHNCSYGYHDSITRGSYLIMVMDVYGEHVMLGINRTSNDEAKYSQCYKRANISPTPEVACLVRGFIEHNQNIIKGVMRSAHNPAKKDTPFPPAPANPELPW